jgi:hypothetical protein
MSDAGSARGGWALRIARATIPSLENYCTLMVLVVVVAQSWRLLLDSDTGWHIRTGDWILQHGRVPRQDLFSFTMPGQPWFAWEWLSDVGMSAIHSMRGLGGIVGVAVVLLTATYALLYRIMVRRGADPFTAFALTLFAVYASMVHWLARPHLISLPLMLLWCTILEQHRRTGTRWVYALPLVIVAWANLHGGFLVAFPVLVVYAMGEWLERAASGQPWSLETRRRLVTYASVTGLSLLGAAVNPYGFGLYRHLWDFFHRRQLLAGNLEFASPDFHRPDGIMVEWLLILGALAAARAASRRRFVEAGLVLLWGHLTLQSQRHVTLATLVILPIVAEQWSQAAAGMMERWSARPGRWGQRWSALRDWSADMVRTDRLASGALLRVLTFGLLIYATATGAADRWLPTQFSRKHFPVAATDFVARERAAGRLRGNLFAHDQWGGYLIYRLYPDIRVFVDGRGDMYAHGTVLDEMVAVTDVEPAWSEVLDRRRVEWILTPPNAPLSSMARASGRWRIVYGDSTAQVLVRESRAQRSP